MDLIRKTKDLIFFNHDSPTPKGVFHLLTITLLSLLLPLSFLLLATLSGARYYIQTLNLYNSQNPFPFSYLFSFALNINPIFLYILVSIVSIATLIHGLTGKVALSSESSSSSSISVFQPHLYIAWILLCTFQVCVGLGIEGSIAAGIYEAEDELNFGAERSLMSKVIFLLGLHETTQIWSRMVVRPVVDDTVFGVAARKERWIERVVMAASLGTVWWWRLREEVEILVVMAEAKKEQLMDVGVVDFVGWWLYYLTVTIGMVRIVKGLMWMFMIPLCRRRTRQLSIVEMESSENYEKV